MLTFWLLSNCELLELSLYFCICINIVFNGLYYSYNIIGTISYAKYYSNF